MSLLDCLIVVGYLVGTIFLGTRFAGRQRDVNTYFVSDRNVSWWLILVSIVATETSTVTFLSVPGLAFAPDGGNLTFLQLAFGYALGRIVVAWLLLPGYLGGNFLSAYQLLRQKFSTSVQRTASAIFLLTRAIADGLRLYLAALLLQQFTGWDAATSVVGTASVTLVYTFFGGMTAVIWTDLIQFLIYIGGAIIAAVFILHQIHGGVDGFIAVGHAAGKFHLLNFSTSLSIDYTLLAGLVGGAFFSMASHGADQIMVQRYLCSRSLRQARIALVSSGVVIIVQFLLFLLIGVGLFVLYQQRALMLPENLAAQKDAVFGYYIVHWLPTGVSGVLIAAVLASSMSVLSSSLNSASSAFVADFYRPLRPGRAESHYLNVARGMTIVWGLTRVAVALLAIRLLAGRSVITSALSIAGFTSGVILGLFLLGRLPRPVSSGSALAGIVGGFATILALWLLTSLSWPWYPLVGTLVTMAAALLLERLGCSHGSPGNRIAEPGFEPPR